MTEASIEACEDAGAPSTPQARAAWVAWRERHQLAALRSVVLSVKRRRSSIPSWDTITDPMRDRILAEAAPDKVCAGLGQDLQGAGMDVSAMYPQAHAAAKALVQAEVAHKPSLPDIAPGTPRGQVLLVSQLPTLAGQQDRTWTAISDEEAIRRLGQVYVKGRVQRWGDDGDDFQLVQESVDRRIPHTVMLRFNAEAWVGREIVLRGLLTSLDTYSSTLARAALVSDASGLTPSTLPQTPMVRKPVVLKRVMSPPGKGLADKDIAAIVIHGKGNYVNGSSWEEDVLFLLRDGTAYRRTDMPPDQLDVAASRQLEPQQWGRWRGSSGAYEVQDQNDDGRPDGGWDRKQHHAVKPWPQNMRLEGSFSSSSFAGSYFAGGISSKRSIRFTKDGRFERSYSSLGTSGSLAGINGANISASSHGDGSGSSSTGGGTVAGPMGTSGAFSSSKTDDGASRRGRYQLSGYVLTLHYDDGRQERLLSFPVNADRTSVYVGSGSLRLNK
ncbi:hypothetical protein [Roseateles asaccharophilus]|uniref:Uncharacterized protein n=2 Tax=Roseateles asaccharophilus TaxID=582607 RepID=A0ABU2A893_9BURK|nr:hypothetical protein [Roseateles asaccharophilus]MDR7333413.1 hypothetical protein [Roseateles asaccharophilus]